MKYDYIMIRFGELTTKGKNKKDFITKLLVNIKRTFSDFPSIEYIRHHDRIYLSLNGEDDEIIIERLKFVFGIQSFSLVAKVAKEIEAIKEKALLAVGMKKAAVTFKVNCRRADKTFPISSDEINRLVAGHILKATNLKVNVQKPEIMINIEIRQDSAYLYLDAIAGAGGFPIGIQSKAMLLISGGIDSPVAGFLTLKRGVQIEAIHFASPPYTSSEAVAKVEQLLERLALLQGRIKLYIVPFTKMQEKIYEHIPEAYAITIMRRMMMRIATIVAQDNNCLALATGESIGQVASQTLESMNVINEVTNLPIIRPLISFDKTEIIKIANTIGTYSTSILPYEDCCTIFTPKQPVTKPKLEKVLEYEQRFDFSNLIQVTINNIAIKYISKENKVVKNWFL